MILEGKYKELYEERFASKTGTPFIKATLILEIEQELYVRKKDIFFNKVTPAAFEYFCTDYRKRDQIETDDDYLIYLKEFKIEAERHDSFIVEVNYTIDCRESGDRYFQSLKINTLKGRPAPIDNLDGDYVDDVTESIGEFPSQEPTDDLPF